MSNEVDLIKEKLDLVDVVKSYIELKKAGKNFKGICPFHQEKDPSFVVSPERQIYHCFGCGAGGDLIEFVKEYEGLTFPETLRFLAEKAGIPIENISKREQKHLDVLYEINKEAKNFFKEQLKRNKNVQKYLESRSFKKETIDEFELGFAPGGDKTAVYLMDQGFDLDNIVKAGLVYKRSRGMLKDRFQKRLVFPIINEIDRTVAFTGRISPRQEKKEKSGPKYLNSPETPVYKKSKILYGLYKSKSHIVDSKNVFLVEGQMDFLMAWQAGLKNLVAVSGTGLTVDHLNKLGRIADTVTVVFDNDSGGLRALERSLDLFSGYDFHVKVVDLGDYSDPAEAIVEDQEFFEKQVENPVPAFRYLFDRYFKKDIEDIAEKKKVIRHLLEKIDNVESSVEQDVWIKELSEKSGISQSALESELKSLKEGSEYKVKFSKEDEEEKSEVIPVDTRIDKISKRLLMLGFTDDELFSIVKDNYKWFPKKFKDILDNPKSGEAAYLSMQSSFEADFDDEEEIKKEINELLKHLKIEALKATQKKLQAKLRSSPDNQEKLANKINKIAKKIEHLKRGEN